MTTPKTAHLLVRAARGEVVERPPVWAMRQAGRWDPEFNRLREGLSFYEFSEDVERAAKASLLPRRFGVDAIILFYDITTLPVAMGLPFSLQPQVGPVPAEPLSTMQQVRALAPRPDPSRYGHIRELLRKVRGELAGDLPVIVFAGAPFTVASYCIGTGKDVAATRRFAGAKPDVWAELLQTLTTATNHFLGSLVSDGADVYQLFDSWAGALTQTEYDAWAQPYHQAVFAAVRRVPRILFVKECPYLASMSQSGADVVSLGVTHDLARARRDYPGLAFQGNVDQSVLSQGSEADVTRITKECLRAGGGRRHIVNLSHGVDKATPVANFQAYINAAKNSGPT